MLKAGFRGGIHPSGHKQATSGVAITRGPVPASLIVPMSQHLGAPCLPVVEKGDHVVRGQVIGTVEAFVSAPIHAPMSGVIAAIRPQVLVSGQRVSAVEITCDEDPDLDVFVRCELADSTAGAARSAGIVGMGGAAFPASVKLTPPHDMPVHTVILNGCECEPYLTCDHRVMLETPLEVIDGARLIRDAVGASRVVVGVEDNKPDAVAALRAATADDVEILSLRTSYPQGAEKQLIFAVLGAEVSHGKLPASTGALVHNVGTAVALARAVRERRPLIERVVTVTGRVVRPGNYLTVIGTSIGELISFAGGFSGEVGRVISGGPMTGMGVSDLSAPVVKGTSGIVVLGPGEVAPAVHGDQPCIRCGRCSDACPMMLQPFVLGIYANKRMWDQTQDHHALDCIECGCCSYVCPTSRPLVQLIRLAKHAQLERGE